jgi:hypothetical protein
MCIDAGSMKPPYFAVWKGEATKFRRLTHIPQVGTVARPSQANSAFDALHDLNRGRTLSYVTLL